MRRKVKIISIILLLCLTACLLCACGESFTYRYVVNTSGGFSKEFILKYDPNAEDAASVKENAIATMENYIQSYGYGEYAKVISDTEGEVSLIVSFPSETDYALWAGVTGREANEPVETEKEGLFVYADREIDNYLTDANINQIRALAVEEAKNFPLTGDFYFVYGTPYKSVKSNGTVTEKGSMYYHEWKVTPNADADIKLRSYGLNGILIYLLVILIFVLSLAVIFVIIYIEKKKTRERFAQYAENASAHIDEVGKDRPDDKE